MKKMALLTTFVLILASTLIILHICKEHIGEMAREEIVVWCSDPLVKLFKDTPTPSEPKKSVYLEAARNEYVAAQFAITVISGNPTVVIKAEPLVGPEGYELDVTARFVGFVPVRKNTPDTPQEELVRRAPFEAPDPILDATQVKVRSGETQPVWITIYVPHEAPPGNYSGEIQVLTEEVNDSISVALQAYPVTIPTQRNLWLTNWFYPEKLAQYYNVEMWSEEHWLLIDKYARDMAEHLQNVIITPLFQLIRFVKGSDGKLRCDFSMFDRWVGLFLRAGVIGRIEGGHLAGRSQWEAVDFDSYALPIYDETGHVSYTQPSMKTSSPEYREFLSQFLPQLQEHLEEMGWLDIYMQHLADEPIPVNSKSYRALAECVRSFAPKLKVIEANQALDLVGALDVWVPILHEFDSYREFYARRIELGDEVWFYTCLAPTGRYLNRFIDYQLIKVRLLHWINFKYNLSGYLHWGLNYWSDKPFDDVEPGGLPSGDAFILYPGKEGPLDSIRFEVMRLGIQDYELLKMLERVDPIKARELVCSVVRSLADYEHDISNLYEARKDLLIILSSSIP